MKELKATYTGSYTAYFQLTREVDLKIWNGSEYVEQSDAIYSDCVITTSREGDFIVADMPSNSNTGWYLLVAYIQSGATPSNTDTGAGERFYWNGTQIVTDTIETTAINTYTSYITIDEAQTYFDTLFGTDAWDYSETDERNKALIQASRDIDSLTYIGDKTDENQMHEFPRNSSNIVPQDILLSVCDIALAYLDGANPEKEFKNLSVVSQGFSDARSTYDRQSVPEHKIAGIISIRAYNRLKQYLQKPDILKISRVN